MLVNVFYIKRNLNSHNYSFSHTLTKNIFNDMGEFMGVKPVDVHISNYTCVSSINFAEDASNEFIFDKIVTSHSIGEARSIIKNRMEAGELDIAHPSFSYGDVIGIGGCFYISTDTGFVLLPLEFNDKLAPKVQLDEQSVSAR
jgi:hypothetical protein